MNNNYPQSQIDHAAYARLRAYDMMSALPDWRKAERIAEHYVRSFATARHLLKFVELTRDSGPTENEAAIMKYMADQLCGQHAADLGIKLEWPPHETHHPSETEISAAQDQPPQEEGDDQVQRPAG